VRSAKIFDRQISEDGFKCGDPAPAPGTDLVVGDDVGVGIECAGVVDPVADALESELLRGCRDADLVAGQMHAEEGSEDGAVEGRSDPGKVAGRTAVVQVEVDGHGSPFGCEVVG